MSEFGGGGKAGDLCTEFEESFKQIFQLYRVNDRLGNLNHHSEINKDGRLVSVEAAVGKFMDLARKLNVEFLQKQHLVSKESPESPLLYDLRYTMRQELHRKEAMLERMYSERLPHYAKMHEEARAALETEVIVIDDSEPEPTLASPPAGQSGRQLPIPRSVMEILAQPSPMRQRTPKETGIAARGRPKGRGRAKSLPRSTSSVGFDSALSEILLPPFPLTGTAIPTKASEAFAKESLKKRQRY